MLDILSNTATDRPTLNSIMNLILVSLVPVVRVFKNLGYFLESYYVLHFLVFSIFYVLKNAQ